MVNLYLVLDENGKVRGCQTTKGTIDNPNYLLVDEETYNEFGKLDQYETMTVDKSGKDMIIAVHPDPRPEIKVTAPAQKKVGEIVTVTLEQQTQGTEEKSISRDSVQLVEYETPDGRIGLVRASFVNGTATCSFTPDKSGYYRFGGSGNYKPETPLIIAVYEE